MTKPEKNYRIIRLEDNPKRKSFFKKKITMIRFYAENRDKAYEEYKDYCKVANKQYKYYLERWSPLKVCRKGKDGKMHVFTYNESEDMFNDYSWWDNFKFFFRYWFYIKPRDTYYSIRDALYLLKHKQEYSNSWLIDTALLKVLEHNLPILRDHKNTMSWNFLNKAILEKHKDDKDFDIKKFYETHIQGFGKDIENKAIEDEKNMFDSLIEDVKLYKYYSGNYIYVDIRNKEEVEFDKKWRHTLPLLKGSYDEYDHNILNKLATKHWNRIWVTIQKYGREMND